jgi:EpsD family peptidyl-prolyl cis-trans isomerase
LRDVKTRVGCHFAEQKGACALKRSLPQTPPGAGRRPAAWALPLPALLAALVLAACGRSGSDANTQVAAKVNREEISVHQVNYVLQRQPGITPDQLESASRKTLEALVDQQLALQAATEQRIDRDPVVLQAIEAARRELIARAYTERLAAGVAPPSIAEVRQYYDSKPALFARRKFYSLVDTAIEATPAEQQTIESQLPTTRNATEVATVVRRAGLRYGARQSAVGAEALPLPAVDRMAAMREGQSILIGGPSSAHVLTIVAVQNAALSFDDARPSIEAYLSGERRRELVQQQIKALRSTARIEYRGRFAAPGAEHQTSLQHGFTALK